MYEQLFMTAPVWGKAILIRGLIGSKMRALHYDTLSRNAILTGPLS